MPTPQNTSAAPVKDASAIADRRAYMKAFRERQKAHGHSRVTVNLSRDDYERMVSSAKAHDEKLTSHLKNLAIAQLEARYLVPPDLAERLDSLVAIMRGIGNNLNQLARHSNEMHYFLDTQEVRLQVKRMEDAVRELVLFPKRSEG